MTRAEQPTVVSPTSDALAADSRERAVRALLRHQPLRRLWSAQLVGGIGDALALLVLLLLTLEAAGPQGFFGGDYRADAFVVAAVFGARLLATLLFGAVLLGPMSALVAPGGPLDRRWAMLAADGVRLALLVVAPLWVVWLPAKAPAMLLVSVFVMGVAERFWAVAHQSAAPALLPAPPLEGAAVRPLPDHLEALRKLSLRTGFAAIPAAAATLLVATLLGRLLGVGLDWFTHHQAALGSYLAAGLFAASLSTLAMLQLPDAHTPRPRSPLEGLRRPSAGNGPDKGRTGAISLLVFACAAVTGAIAAAAAVSVLHASDLGRGAAVFALLVLGLAAGTGVGIRVAAKVLPALSRRRMLALAIAVTGVALLAMALVPDTTTVLLLALLAGVAAGVAANTGHTLLDLETEDYRRARTTEHLQAVVRLTAAVGVLAGPLLAAAIGFHRLQSGTFVFIRGGGAGYTLMLVGVLLLPVAALVLAKADDRQGVPLRRDLREAIRGGQPGQAPSATGFFIALEGGDGAGKSTQAKAIADWIRAKGHEVVVTREPGATPIGKRLRSILLDVSSAGLSNRAEALLYAADRAEHVDSVVRPALERGAVVITDRYIDSSVAYQGAGRDLAPTEIARMSRWATHGLVPHLTVLLDVSPETARERFTEAPDRLESEPPEFHARVRAGFLTLAAADASRYLVVDAGQEPEAVTTVVRHRLDRMLPMSEQEIAAAEAARKAAEEEARRLAEEEAARKAEEERIERERQEQLARLRAEEEERKRREIEEARQREAERQAEEARQRAEEARRQAEEERKRREAEAKARAAEQERLRKQAEEEARLRAEAEERRREKQRKAEEALLRAEEARRAAETASAASAWASTAAATAAATGKAAGAGTPAGQSGAPAGQSGAPAGQSGAPAGPSGTPAEHSATPAPATPDPAATTPAPAPPAPAGARPVESDSEVTVQTPVVRLDMTKDAEPESGRGPADDSAPWAGAGSRGSAGVPRGAADETAVLPPVRPGQQAPAGAADETAVLPPVRDGARAPQHGGAAGMADRVPPGYFRDEAAGESGARSRGDGTDRTRELPQFNPDDPGGERMERPRRRSDWAEETPLDDLPSLADELLGDQDDPGEGRGPRGGRGGRRS
ncbi:dTMP kinase [Streptomyces sp. NPDC058657]|uniref:dTMP kinase n=1 Tax=unclassified Streptomyces TaxID=2593676 RepID=UPI003669AD71